MSKPRSSIKSKPKREELSGPDVWKGSGPPIKAFEPVARLVAPEPPQWLKEHFSQWFPLILSASAIETLQPSRVEIRTILRKVEGAPSRQLHHAAGRVATMATRGDAG